jgi:hypothetical protein
LGKEPGLNQNRILHGERGQGSIETVVRGEQGVKEREEGKREGIYN